MASYKSLKAYPDDKAAWISKRLIELRRTIRASDLGRRDHENLVIGSWNIRAFDEGTPRRDESYHYIAEIIDHFDICAVQEVKQDLWPLQRLVKLLGPNWDYFVTDVTEGGPGNRERQAFLYNKTKVFFRNLVGEIVLGNDALIEGEQIARTPFFASFQSGWFRLEGEVYVLIGDMNIEKRGDSIFKGLSDHGLTVPLFGPTNLGGTKYYDQIAFTSDDIRTEFVNSGSVDWRDDVFGDSDKDHYETLVKAEREAAGKKPYSNWESAYQNYFASFEMSDHLPVWVEIKTDYSDDYLGKFLAVR